MNRTYIDRNWTYERRVEVGERYQRIMAAKTRRIETKIAETFVKS